MDNSLNSILSDTNKSQSQGLTISSNLRKTKKVKNEINSNKILITDNQINLDYKFDTNLKNSSDNIYDISIN